MWTGSPLTTRWPDGGDCAITVPGEKAGDWGWRWLGLILPEEVRLDGRWRCVGRWRGGLVEVFGADDAQAGGGGAGSGAGEGEAGERGHEEGLGRLALFRFAEQEADARAVDAGGVGAGGLGDDDAGRSGCGDVSDGTEFEPETADVDGGGALGLTEDVGDRDLLGAEALSDADGPLAADCRARGG